jgi:hypothetical protein
LTVTAFTTDANGAIDSITFSGGSASDADAVKLYDKFQFSDGVSGKPNIRFLTFIGQHVSQQPVQFRATADAATNGGGSVTIPIYPPLITTGNAANISVQVQIGMQVTALPNHRAGLITTADAFYIGMPMLPEEVPFPTANETDPDTGVSMRQYYGSLFGQNQRGMVHDAIWGRTLVPEYGMSVIFPV